MVAQKKKKKFFYAIFDTGSREKNGEVVGLA